MSSRFGNDLAAYFEITKPANTELWNQGDTVSILWNSHHHSFATVAISLFTRRGEEVRSIAKSADDKGSIQWLVDIPIFYSVDTLFQIRISSTAFTHTYSESGYFRINHGL